MEVLARVADVFESGYGMLALLTGILMLWVAPGKRANQALADGRITRREQRVLDEGATRLERWTKRRR